MQDDVETFLSLKPRSKEWLPELPGLHKLSRSEAQVDLDQIIANLHQTPTVAQLQALGLSNDREDGKSRKPIKKDVKGKEKEPNSQPTTQSGNEALTAVQAVSSDSGINDRRRRLQEKIGVSRDLIQSDHAKAAQLRLELDQLRNEILSYEDAILQAKREIEAARRERSEIELQFNAIRSEYELQLHKLNLSRSDAEATEAELKQRLTKSARENADLSERLHQLRQLEDEFKLKDAKIDVLQLQNAHGHRKLFVYEHMSNICSDPNATHGAILSAFTTALNNVTRDVVNEANYTHDHSFPVPMYNLSEADCDKATTTAFRDAVRSFLDLLVQRDRTNKLLAEESADKSILINEHMRSSRSLISQLEKSTNIHSELHLQMRQMEVAYSDEVAKTEAALKTIQLLQKQKSDQQTLLFGYEERMKHFQQLLTAADVRADSANTFLSELLKQWNVLKYGCRTLQSTVNTMKSEMRKMVKERNDAYLELNDRVSKYANAVLANNNIAPVTPPAFNQSTGQSSIDRYWIEKDKKLESHFQSINTENATLREELSKVERLLQDKNNQSINLVERSVYESSIQSINSKVEQYKRGILEVQSALDEQIKRKRDADQSINQLENEIRALKADRQAEQAQHEEELKQVNHSLLVSITQAKLDESDEHKAKKRKVESAQPVSQSSTQSINQSINQSNTPPANVQANWTNEGDYPNTNSIDMSVVNRGFTEQLKEIELQNQKNWAKQANKQSSNQSIKPHKQINLSPTHPTTDMSKRPQLLSPTISQPINQSINQPINQSVSQSTSPSVNQSINQSPNSFMSPLIKAQPAQSTNQSINQSKPADQHMRDQPPQQSIHTPINQSINQSINQPINQTISQSNQPANPLILPLSSSSNGDSSTNQSTAMQH